MIVYLKRTSKKLESYARKKIKKCQKHLIAMGNVSVFITELLLTDFGFYGE